MGDIKEFILIPRMSEFSSHHLSTLLKTFHWVLIANKLKYKLLEKHE